MTGVTRRLMAAVAVGTVMSVAGGLAAQDAYPEKPVTIIVSWAAGGATDLVTRAMQEKFAEELGTDVIIKNVTGAAGTIGTAEVAAADPDGYTVHMTPLGPVTIQPHLRNLPYDLDAFKGIGRVSITPMLMMVAPNSGFETLDDYIAAAKEQPGQVTVASTGAGTLPHISIIAFDQAAGIQSKHVPFQGSADVMKALLGDTVQVFSDQAHLAPRYDLHSLAAWSDERLPEYPDVPTLKELGYDLSMQNWLGMFVPAGTPDEVVEKLDSALRGTLEDPAVIEQLAELRVNIDHLGPTELDEFAQAEYERNRELLSSAGLLKQ